LFGQASIYKAHTPGNPSASIMTSALTVTEEQKRIFLQKNGIILQAAEFYGYTARL